MKSISNTKYFVVKLAKLISYHKYSLVKQTKLDEKNNLPGYPTYPESEDIYNQWKEEEEIDPEQVTKNQENEVVGENNEKDFAEDFSGNDLDVPGSELDDKEEKIRSEDEENNFYSLGGDDHNDLEEDKNNLTKKQLPFKTTQHEKDINCIRSSSN